MALPKALRTWLRVMDPQPTYLRIHTADDEVRVLEVAQSKNRWAMAERTVQALHATIVEALDADKNILDAWNASDVSGGSSAGGVESDAATEKLDMQRLSIERRELAQTIDSMGERAIEAYQAGAKAASEQQDKLLKVIEIMLNNMTVTITNVNAIASEIAEARSEGAEEKDDKHGQNGAQLGGLLAAGLSSLITEAK